MVIWNNDTKNSSSWSSGLEYLITELYERLLTEDNKNIITNQSQDALPVSVWTQDII